MNKVGRLIKKLVALFVVLAFSIESFAAVVGDNDGAAFITKAEFESLKNDFQSQIDRYTTSLDNKIDGTIATYLAGVRIATTTKLNPRIGDYYNISWMNGFYWPCEEIEITSDTDYTVTDLGWQKMEYSRQRFIRNNNLRFWCNVTGDIGNLPFFLKVNTFNNTTPSYVCYAGNGMVLPCPYWRLSEVNGTWSYVDKNDYVDLVIDYEMAPLGYGAYSADATTSFWCAGQPDWTASTYGFSFNNSTDTSTLLSPIDNGVSDGQYINISVPLYVNNTSTTKTANLIFNSQNSNIGSESHQNTAFTGLMQTSAQGPRMSDSVRNRLVEVYKYFLLGNDDTALCNVGYMVDQSKTALGPRKQYDYSSADVVEKTGDMLIYVFCYQGRSNSLARVNTLSDISFGWPLWPQISHMDLTNGMMLIDGVTPAKVGDGLPLVKEISNNGTLKIQLYGANYDIDSGSAATDKSVKVYIKKGSFASTSFAEFYTLSDGTSLNGYSISDFSTSTTLEFSVEKGDEIWMRVGPNTTSAGSVYTKISNITMTLENDA